MTKTNDRATALNKTTIEAMKTRGVTLISLAGLNEEQIIQMLDWPRVKHVEAKKIIALNKEDSN